MTKQYLAHDLRSLVMDCRSGVKKVIDVWFEGAVLKGLVGPCQGSSVIFDFDLVYESYAM